MTLARIRNGRPIARADVPRLSFEDFRRAVTHASSEHKRVSALFGATPGSGEGVELFVVLASDRDGYLELATTLIEGGSFPSMTTDCPEVHLFEREIAEQWGVVPEGHPWLKPVRFRGGREPGVMDFHRIEGEAVHEVAVGPIHAGVIEPGHFRFQCHGEHVFHLEISLGYQHRGVERALAGGPTKRTIPIVETLAGDTTVGHTTAYCQLVEGLSGARVPARALVLRGIALELERLANHTGALGGVANDVGFLPTGSYCGRIRGDFLNLTALVCGNRFGRGLVRPGGVVFDVDETRVRDMRTRLQSAARDVAEALDLMWNSSSVMARLEGTGVVSADAARAVGLVGVAARACGLERDARQDHPSGVFRLAHVPVSVWHTGDVFARAYVRGLEIERSCAFILDQLGALPRGKTRAPCGRLAPDSVCVSLVEGFRGEICHVATTDRSGQFASYKVIDPSFHDWIGLALALRDETISDFPLCNKSFDLSYCGHDL